MVELMLQTPGSIPDLLAILDVIDFGIPALLALDVLDGNNILVKNVTNHL